MFAVLGFLAQVCVIAAVVACVISTVFPVYPMSYSYVDSDGSVGMSCLMIIEPSSDDLSFSTVKELRALAKDRGLKGVSNLRKAELVAAIYDSYLFD